MVPIIFQNLDKSKGLTILFLTLWCLLFVSTEEIHTTKVFFMPIGPFFFNWNSSRDLLQPNAVFYRPSLLDAPDLPNWMYYTYNEENNTGFIYGVPPHGQNDFQVEIVGINRKKYDVKRKVIKMKVIEKKEKAQFEVQMKIDKLNVEEMFRDFRYNTLLNIFRNVLWKESASDIYVTFIASAVELGARLPLNPDEGEGIIIHLGSKVNFSSELKNLEKEVQPLRIRKDDTCSGFKAMSVERYFREYNFTLDWCAFRLVYLNSDKSSSNEVWAENFVNNKVWKPPQRDKIPSRNYFPELAITIFIPIITMIMLAVILSFILCLHYEEIEGNESTPDVLMVQYESVQKVSKTLRSLSNQREEDKFLRTSPRLNNERNSGIRPNPPPYTSIRQNPPGDM